VSAASSRDRYLDALRAAALGRVVVFHMFGFAWLSFVFPAMGVMFALGGSLMAASMARSATGAVRGRIRRLLPALWVLGAIVVPVMFWHGWTTDDAYGRPLYQIVFWVVPIADPPGNAWAESATVVLWYLVTYLWLVLLSPLAWRAYRRFPLPTVLLPLVVLVLTQLGPVDVGGPAGDVVVNVTTFGACWLVGFAHRAGQLARINTAVVVALAGCCAVVGAAWAVTHPADDGTVNLNDIPLAQAVYSLGFVLVALRFPPPMGWLARIRPLDAAVTVLNARAVTVYLWHNVAIALAFPLGDVVGAWHLGDAGYLALAVVLLTVAVGGLGWVEDLAARRRPALVPPPAAGRPLKVPAVVVTGEVPAQRLEGTR
jgi:peptidoglycan-N-acetylglucosamine deacetylase